MIKFVLFLSSLLFVTKQGHSAPPNLRIDPKNGNITLPQHFSAVVVAENTGKARHIIVSPNGDVFVRLSKLQNGKGLLQLRDTTGDGKADATLGYGNYIGTGIALYNNYLYASSDSSVYRYKLLNNTLQDEELVVTLPYRREHSAKSITIDENGKLYVNIGAPSNACQEQDRTQGSKGQDPCPLLNQFGGIWQFDANKTHQKQADGKRFATGIRNAVALEWDSYSKQLFAVQHGRDQLSMLYPDFYNETQSAELPSEEFLLLKDGANFGWPYCYNDHFQGKKILAPEYGGDGKAVGRCSEYEQPILTFPGHWAPNDLLFYHGTQFPERYKNGAFIAFHGSWNRAPLKQGGYFVAFVPFSNGKPSGKWEVFAEGFAGGPEITSPNDAKHRPMGLAEGPDGSLYITDSVKGKIWRIVYIQK